MTDRIPLNDMTSDQLDQLHDEIGRLQITNRALNTAVVEAVERAERAEAEARAWAEAESADIAAGSYAGRVQELEAELAALRAVARGYCPACGRGDAAPTVEDWERERKRAEETEQQRDRYKAAWYSARNGRERARHELAVADVAYEHADQQYVQQRQRAEQAEELLRIAHDTSNKSEAERARFARIADDRADNLAELRSERARLRTRLAEQEAETMRQLDRAERAEAAIACVRATVAALSEETDGYATTHNPECECEWIPATRAAIARITAALDQPAPAATEATEDRSPS